MYDTILYPTDGSAGSEAALDHVAELAGTYGATVHVLHAVDSSAHLGLGIGGDPKAEDAPGMVGHPDGDGPGMVGERDRVEHLRERMEEQGETLVEEVTSQLADVDTEAVVRGGDPHQIIIDYAEEIDADLIVMGTHGRTGIDRYLLGSVAEKVVRLSDVPVVTVRREET